MASSHVKFDERNEQVASGGRPISFDHQGGLIKVRMFAKLLFGQFHDVGVSSRKLPALERIVEEINAHRFRRDENALGMLAADNDARTCKEPHGINSFP
jgi:hypothetical protein